MKKLKYLSLIIVAVMIASVFSAASAVASDPSVTLPDGLSFTTNPSVVTDGEFGDAWNVTNNGVGELRVNPEAGKTYILKYDVRVASGGTGIIAYTANWANIPTAAFTWEASGELKYPTSTGLYPDLHNEYVTVIYIINTSDNSTRLALKYAESGTLIYSGEATGDAGAGIPRLLQIRSFPGGSVFFKNVTFEEYVPNMVESVSINGTFDIGQTVTGTFVPLSGYEDLNCTYRWLISATEDGEYTPIEDKTANTLYVEEEYADKFIKFEVTPVSGGVTGKTCLSNAVQGNFAPIAKNVRIALTGECEPGAELVGSFEYYDANYYSDDNDGRGASVLSWYRLDSVSDTEHEFIANGGSYIISDADIGKYIVFGVKPISLAFPTDGVEVFSTPFECIYIPDMIDSVSIDGIFDIGQTLTGTVVPLSGYEDLTCTYRWLISDSVSGEYEPILNETASTLYVEESYADKFIKLEVTPILNEITGMVRFSGAVSRMFKPVAENVHILGQKIVGNTLEGKYTFSDANPGENEDEAGTIYAWYRYDSDENDFVVIEGETTRFYTVREGDTLIKFSVQPKSDNAPYLGDVFYSEPVSDPVAPVAENVRITGESEIGFELTGSYEYYDENRDEEGTSVLTWYRLDSVSDTEPEVIGSGNKYTISEEDVGKYIVFGVKPISVLQPIEGVEVKSEVFECPTKSPVTLPEGIRFTTDPSIVTDSDFGNAWNVTDDRVGELNVNPEAGKIYKLKYDVRVASGGTGILTYTANWGSIPTASFTWESSWDLKYPGATLTGVTPDFHNQYVTVEYTINTINNSTELLLKYTESGDLIYNGRGSGNADAEAPKLIQIRSFPGGSIFFKNVTFEEYIPDMIETASINGTFEVGQTLTGTFVPLLGYEGLTCTYRWLASDKLDGEYEPLEGEVGNTLVVKEEYSEKFIKFEATPTFEGIVGKACLSTAIEREFKPIAENVYIFGQKIVGNILEGKYTFYDKNISDNEDASGSVYAWYKYDSASGEFVVIEGETTRFYTVQEGDTLIKFSVQPKSDNAPYLGDVFYSEAVSDPVAPVANNVKLTGEPKLGFELIGSYEYYDENRDEEGTSVLTWYRLDSETDAEPEVIGNGDKYTISEDDIGKYILFGVKPVSSLQPFVGVEVKSTPFECPSLPSAINVKIKGDASSGKTLTGKYDYVHNLDVAEGESKYSWLMSSSRTGTYTEIGNTTTLLLNSSHVGKYIKFSVTPIASEEPKVGIAVESTEVYISENKGSSGLSGSGGGITISASGGGGGSANKMPQSNIQTMMFKDISGHWAHSDIEWAFKNGIVNGLSQEEFAPDKSLSAAELVTMLVRGTNIKTNVNNSQNSLWYTPYLEAANKNNITKNINLSNPNEDITRASMAILLVNTYEFMSGKVLPINENIIIKDADLMTAEELTAVKKAMSAGLLNGMGDNYYSPKTKTTRAQSATIMKRLLNIK